ncbi:Ankyrin repeat domain-containing protein, chloroplastic, partial [Mucuna pruriens]
MEGTMFRLSTVMPNLQPHTLFSPLPISISIFPSATTPRRFQSLNFPTKCNARSENRDIGDCVVFEDGIFQDDTVFQNDTNLSSNRPKRRTRKGAAVNMRENLVPNKWREAQAESIITIHERRKKKIRDSLPLRDTEKMELKSTVQKKGKGPLRDINWDEYKASKKAKLTQLNPLLLKNPSTFPVKEKVPEPLFNAHRVEPKNPRELVCEKGLEDVIQFFNSGSYNPNPSANTAHQGRRNLFTITKDEVFLLNKRMPDLSAATSRVWKLLRIGESRLRRGKWLPLHTLAAAGELYLLDSLLKHNVDINAVDKDGLTALHKVIGKKQTITNYLLRNSANPFVQDKEGATLMHHAVQIASTETIELLLLYNVDINLQDNDGWTPLHLAVQTQRPDLVRLLLIKGADKTLRNKDGCTPLDLCLYSGQSQLSSSNSMGPGSSALFENLNGGVNHPSLNLIVLSLRIIGALFPAQNTVWY